jgi:hypothetical protein
MRAPTAGWLSAGGASLLLLLLVSLFPGAPALESIGLDLKHRWVALTAGRTQPVVAASPPPVAAHVRNSICVNVFLEQEVEPAKRQRSLELLREAGAGWIRQQIPWEQIEPVAKGQFEDPKFGGSTWKKFDDIIDTSRALGIEVILRLDTSPRWALPPDAVDGLSPPVRYEDYWDFAETVATRYRGRVRAYQVWNEPNLHIEWGRRPPDAAAYGRLLRGAAERIRGADPDALVLMAALSPTLSESPEAVNELVYLQQLYDAGARGSFDALAVQAYGLRGGPDDPRVDRSDVTFSRPRLIREVMIRKGDAERPVWATEVGWNVNPPEVAEQRFGRVTPPLQARYTVRAFERAREQWPWMELMCVWYWKRADATHRAQDWYWFRLADPDFTLQPVYHALRDYATWRPS